MLKSEETLLNDAPVENHLRDEESVGLDKDPLNLDIKDDELVKIVDKRIDDSRNFFKEKYQLYERRRRNEIFRFGRQISDKESRNELKDYEARYLNNALYEIEASIKPIATSKLPDMIVLSVDEAKETQDLAKDLTKGIDSDIKKRESRRALSLAFEHLPVYFTGIVKVRWDPNKGKNGDYIFENVHPDYVDIDHTCQSNNADQMSFVSQILPITVQEAFLRFPEAKTALKEALQQDGIFKSDTPEWKSLATQIKIREVWFTWYKNEETGEIVQDEDQTTDDVKWSAIEGVLWKYKKVLLKKMKNPNFDYDGTEKMFIYDIPGDESTRREVQPEDVMIAMTTGIPPEFQTDKIYNNYFDHPRKPFYFMGYDQWNKIAYDETSRIEQNIRNQENLDKRGKQIQETLADRGKHVFSMEGGLRADDIEEMDMEDPHQDILVRGNVRDTHDFIQPQRPSAPEFQDLSNTRANMFSLAGATALTGALQTDVATSNQIAREENYTRVDDLTEDTINAAAEWMAGWIMQMIKLRYTEYHFKRVLGEKGVMTFQKLSSMNVQDGMEVMIKASGTDKLKAQRNAMDMAKLKMIDPLTYFEDMALPDPKGRTERLMAFNIDPNTYMLEFVKEQDVTPQGLAQQLGAQTAIEQGMPSPGVPQGQPQAPAPTDTTQIAASPPPLPQGSVRA